MDEIAKPPRRTSHPDAQTPVSETFAFVYSCGRSGLSVHTLCLPFGLHNSEDALTCEHMSRSGRKEVRGTLQTAMAPREVKAGQATSPPGSQRAFALSRENSASESADRSRVYTANIVSGPLPRTARSPAGKADSETWRVPYMHLQFLLAWQHSAVPDCVWRDTRGCVRNGARLAGHDLQRDRLSASFTRPESTPRPVFKLPAFPTTDHTGERA